MQDKKENLRGRICLQFNLTDAKQKQAYEILLSQPQRGKSKYLADLIDDNKEKSDFAETVAALVVERITSHAGAEQTEGKRKRGRPPKEQRP